MHLDRATYHLGQRCSTQVVVSFTWVLGSSAQSLCKRLLGPLRVVHPFLSRALSTLPLLTSLSPAPLLSVRCLHSLPSRVHGRWLCRGSAGPLLVYSVLFLSPATKRHQVCPRMLLQGSIYDLACFATLYSFATSHFFCDLASLVCDLVWFCELCFASLVLRALFCELRFATLHSFATSHTSTALARR